ncbi:hypothetical protein ABZ924_37685 [Streptomyces sp. NPDC046876]|uniref:hypothetical protein n=1 Tax=Streptomyces sp. NPDC046876 TaxID=3155616 RepID=UPI0033F96D5B
MAEASRGEVLADLPGNLRAQRYGPTDRPQPTVLVVAAEDKELRGARVPVAAPMTGSLASLRRILVHPR